MMTNDSTTIHSTGETPRPNTEAASPGLIGTFAPMMLMLLAFYFLLMRPQQKREAKRRELVNSAKKDDKVLTSSGIIGKVHKFISAKEVSLEIAEGVRIRILPTSIVEILDKGSELGQDSIAESKKKHASEKSKELKEKEPETSLGKSK